MPSVITQTASPKAAKTTHFGSHRVLEEQLITEQRRFYIIGYENGEFRLGAFADVLFNALTEFALGLSGPIEDRNIHERISNAANRIANTDRISSKGEWGELILHLLMRDFLSTTPLLSKIYFKDTFNIPAHGFDGVHYRKESNGDWELWLGESKIYASANGSITSLLEDIKNHVNPTYIRGEFALINQKINSQIHEREEIIELMHKHTRIENIYAKINIVLTATYSCDKYESHNSNTDEFKAEISDFCKELINRFDNEYGKLRNVPAVNIYLLLVPVKDKSQLVKKLNDKLKAYK